jgi:mannose-6-phosphate isomerase
MSFMFNPFPYDDPMAINRIAFDEPQKAGITRSTRESGKAIAVAIQKKLAGQPNAIIGLDGYISAPTAQLAGFVAICCEELNIPVKLVSTRSLFLGADILNEKLRPYLPEDRVTDPVLLFGSLFKEGYEGLMSPATIAALQAEIKAFRQTGTGLLIVHGNAALLEPFISLCDLKLYVDMTQKRTILNFRSGKCANLGADSFMGVNEMLRRAYYIDFEAAGELRGHLINSDLIDYYLTGDHDDLMQMMPLATLKALFRTMVTYPLRCRPVYIEGVWGGFFIKRLRNLPAEMKNCAWVFDMIPMEVSIVADVGDMQLEFPFYCFVQTVGEELMGSGCVAKYGGYFPVRFNYDDTYHSSGNMSIQVHPDAEYVRTHNKELNRQDESYYIVTTGQKAKTYIGFKDDANVEEFIEKAKRAEQFGEDFDHDQFVNSVPSRPGLQFMLPAGTIHSSGRNQVILEIGSLTIGSYTYKMYDYMRKDLEGKLRPIHTFHGDKVLRRDFRASWVKQNLVQQPRTVREGDGWQEIIVGEHDLLYFTLRNLVFTKKIEDATTDRFHVLSLVDGEKVLIRSLTDPTRCFEQNYLDIVTVPATFGPYEIINLGVGTVVVHKTMLKDGFELEA